MMQHEEKAVSRLAPALAGGLWRVLLMAGRLVLTLASRVFARFRHGVRKAQQADAVAGPAAIGSQSVAIEALYQTLASASGRVVAVIGVEEGAGVTSLTRALAFRFAQSGRSILLLDASRENAAHACTYENSDPFRTVHVTSLDNGRFNLRDVEALRRIYALEFAAYDIILIDCAPAQDRESDAFPGPLLARSADKCILACLGASVRTEDIVSARKVLASADVCGIAINGRDQPTLGEEIAREALRLSGVLPGFARRLARKAAMSEFLDVRI